MTARFRNRIEAGQLLAAQLKNYSNRSDVLVLGLPRGGVPVAYEVAKALNAPLDICLVCKLGVPGHKEISKGAFSAFAYEVAKALNAPLDICLVRKLGVPGPNRTHC